MKTWPLRTQLTLWSAAVTALALLVFGLAAAANLYFEQLEAVDRRLAASAQDFLPATAGKSDAEVAALIRRDDDPPDGFALFHAGRVTAGEPATLATRLLERPPRKKFTTLRLDEKLLRAGYFVTGDRALLLAVDLRHVSHSITELAIAYLLALPVVLLVVAAGSWWMARRALAPIAAITTAAGAITAENLSARLMPPPADDEIARLTRVLNAMLDRLERSFAQATRFSADASHELRTPLTILRGEIEQALHGGGFTAGQEKLLVGLLEQVGGLQKISDNLLLLARFDAGRNPAQLAPVDLSGLLADAVEDAELLAAPIGLKVLATVAPGVRISGDAVLLRRLLLNLVDNAVRYNRPGGEVRLGLRDERTAVVLTFANTGAGIPPERHGELFARFFRLDPDRNSDTGGSGLGLSLCREIATAHGGRIELTCSAADATEFEVTLPVGKL